MRCAACDTLHPPTEPCATLVRARAGRSGTLLFSAGRPPEAPGVEAQGTEVQGVEAQGTAEGQRLEAGAPLGHFRILRTLGAGGMGTVYLAEHALLGTQVALKVLHPRLALDADLVRRFITEARTIGRLAHEHVVSLLDLQVVPPGHYVLVMEYLEGVSLQGLVGQPLPPEQVVHILSQVCDALDAAHALGVVHRDLKPANIFLTRRAGDPHYVKLLDFGIAKLMADTAAPRQTLVGMVLGTPEYMAPEQGAGEAVDGRTDLYALGVVAYQLLTGVLPFTGRSPAELLIAHAQQEPLPPSARVPAVPEALSRVVLRALEKRPADRFPSAAAMRAALEGALRATSSRRAAPLRARVTLPEGREVWAACLPVSRTGLHVALAGPLPPLRSELTLVLALPGGERTCRARVVQQVTEAQARTWGLEPGVGVELLAPGLHAPPSPSAPGPAPAPGVTDEEVEVALRRFARTEDHYVLLGLPRDADLARIRRALREARTALEALQQRPLTAPQQARVQRVLDRVAHAQHVLTHPERRAEYDGALRNWRGVARCLEMGLTATGLERVQRRYHAENPRRATHAAVLFHTARALERAGRQAEALDAYERALELDPLSLLSHQQHRTLRARLQEVHAGEGRAG